jgi:hypothetical protein
VTWTRAGLALAAVVALAAVALSGGSGADPETPEGLPGMPRPFLGTAVAGSGELTAAVDAYGDVVDLRASPAGPALIENPHGRQAAGTVAADTGIVPRVRVGGRAALPLWEADSVEQRYLPGTNVVRTLARFGAVEVAVTVAAAGRELAVEIRTDGPSAVPSVGVTVEHGVRCRRERHPGQHDLLCRVGRAVPDADGAAVRDTGQVARRAVMEDRRWVARAQPLGSGAPDWVVAMYERSLLTLRALTDRETGAVAAGARDGWAYVWPRDAATAALAFAAAGYDREAELATRFLLGVSLEEAARFHGDGSPVSGRAAQGDAIGWITAAAEASGMIGSAKHAARILGGSYPVPWRDRADYQEGDPGDYLGNAIASGASEFELAIARSNSEARNEGVFSTPRGLVRRAGEPKSGLDSAAAWAVRPFSTPAIYPAVRRTLNRLLADGTRFGITPGEGWHGGIDPWMAPTAWSAWAFAALAASPSSPDPAADRRQALELISDLRRATTPAGALPERVDAHTGVPTSTTPLAWPHAFAVLALRELWPLVF